MAGCDNGSPATGGGGGGGTTFTVTFDTGGGTPVPMAQTVTQGTFATAPANMTRTGYNFLGWFEGEAETAFDFGNTPVTRNIALTARWSSDPVFTVTFNTHNGTPVPPVQNVTQGGFATRPAPNPTRTGFTFVDWFTTAETGGAVFAFATTPINAATVVHARWQAVATFTVTFDSAGGSAVASQTGIASGGVATEPTPPTRTAADYGREHRSRIPSTAGIWAARRLSLPRR